MYRYAADLVLIRADHIVAWRSDAAPGDPTALWRKLVGKETGG